MEDPSNWKVLMNTNRRSLDAIKGIALVTLLVLTLVSSMLPFLIRRAVQRGRAVGRRRWLSAAFGLLSCFGGGVFLSTALLDLLPDSHDKIQGALRIMQVDTKNFPLSEFLVAIGFFLVLFIEQIVLHFKETGSVRHSSLVAGVETEPGSSNTNQVTNGHKNRSNSDVHKRNNANNLNTIEREAEPVYTVSDGVDGALDSFLEPQIGTHPPLVDSYPVIGDDYSDLPDVHFDPQAHSTLRAVLLVLALSMHATFEGLAVGLQDTVAETLQIFAALCLHKTVIAFSLGLRLVQSSLSHCAIFLCCLVFSGTATFGGLLGLAAYDFIQSTYSDLVGGCLQAVACGTFLYVVSFEILPHELNQPGRRLLKLLMLLFGFAIISTFVYLYPA